MKFIADFHIHSHFSRATSKELVPEQLNYWARLKGITVVGTGDFTHPGWTKELKEKLQSAEYGLFKLKDQYKNKNLEIPFLPNRPVRFMLTAEISNIYKKNGKVRKVHNVIFAPDFETVEKIQQELTNIETNITSDGRPILGLDSRDLLEMMLECSEDIFFVPAHIWTPWFSILGSKSGFDSVDECFNDLVDYIYAVETGLSTDPPMNWMCRFLDKYTLISNSDAHSPEKLGRNANCFNTELSYAAIIQALKTGDPDHFHGTIDLFPQEGKYHYDGHRKCRICWDPAETLKHNNICPECNKPVTVGVLNRIVQLSDREDLSERPNRAPFYSIIPLKEILAEMEGVGPGSKKVTAEYMSHLKGGFTELDILLDVPVEEIERIGTPQFAEAVRRMRNREVDVKEGFDGEYGVITVFDKGEANAFQGQELLFKDITVPKSRKREQIKTINFDLVEYRLLQKKKIQFDLIEEGSRVSEGKKEEKDFNPEQMEAVQHYTGPALVIAGPGTGKTWVLTHRIVHLIRERSIKPENILAVTFTNKAAAEIKERLDQFLEENARPQVTTFHALGYSILKEIRQTVGNWDRCSPQRITSSEKGLIIIDPEDKKRILQNIKGCEKRQVNKIAGAIREVKQQLKTAAQIEDKTFANIFRQYESRLKELNVIDLEDLIYLPVRFFSEDTVLRDFYQKKYSWILVDEYQDVNFAQYRLIRDLVPSGRNANLCVIGDPDQAIYGFRGANVRFIRAFQEDYPNAVLFRLKKSYRCTDSILQASGRMIGRDDSKGGALKGIDKGVKIQITETKTDKSEAEFVARTIEQMMGGLRFFSMDSSITGGNKQAEIESLSDFVVLCRVKAQMDSLEKAFNRHSIPYQVIGDTPFFQREPVKSVVDLLKISLNPLYDYLKERLLDKKIISHLELLPLIEFVREQPSLKSSIALIIERCFSEEQPKNESIFNHLLKLVEPYEADINGREAFFQFVTTGKGVDTYRSNLENVALMTLHAAKGLEFRCVFIVGCEEGLLPFSLFKQWESDWEEEKRLLYVGMTRAQKFLFLSHTEKRWIGGREYRLKRSPFLTNIEKQLTELSRHKSKKKEPVQRSLFE